MTKIKICGLSRPRDIDYVNEAKPDYIGFVFWEKSRRYVTGRQAGTLRERLDADIAPVGVFVNEKPEIIAGLANAGIIDLIQLHGSEDEAYLRTLKTMTEKPVIKAFQMTYPQGTMLPDYPADYYLIDSGKGCGKTLNWDEIPDVKKPWFLAGGISADNVQEAIGKLHPYGVDFSSSVETDGCKDREKILEIVRRIRDV